MDAADVVDVQLGRMAGIALRQPLIAVVDAEHAAAFVDGLDRRGRDDAVDARRRPAADEDAERRYRFHVCLRLASATSNSAIRGVPLG